VSDDERPIGEDDLLALVDGRLTPERTARVEAFLADHPEAAARVADHRAQRDALRARLAFKAEEPIPARLRVAAIAEDIRTARRRARSRRLSALAATVAWLAVGGLVGWQGRGLVDRAPGGDVVQAAGGTLVGEAFAAHRVYVSEVLHPVEVAATQEAHLVSWLSKRLGHPLRAPDLSALGYRLMGGRLLPAGAGAAALFMYEDPSGARLTLHARNGESGETAFRFAEDGAGSSAFFWKDRGLGYVLVGELDRTRLLAVAEVVHRQVEGAGS
jgi:anti-sigma factor RsiW